MKKVLVVALSLLMCCGFCLAGCTPGGQNEKKIKDDKNPTPDIYKPFWDESQMYQESVVLVKGADGLAKGELLFKPDKIISVTDHTLVKRYAKEEYRVEGKKLIAVQPTDMPFFTEAQMQGKDLGGTGIGTHFGKPVGGKLGDDILYTEGAGIIERQVWVTYEHSGEWNGPIPQFGGDTLKKTIDKLQTEKDLKLFLYGDSISVGANSSGFLGISPYYDDYGTAVKKQLKYKYGGDIEYKNGSFGGWHSVDAKNNIQSKLGEFNPDLAIIAFGMNDGAHGIQPDQFKDNILAIMQVIREKSPDCEFLLIGTILANPLSPQDTHQLQFVPALESIAESNPGCAVVDMSTFTQELYKSKKGVDILANNINHPSDFLVRCYVMNIMTVLYENY